MDEQEGRFRPLIFVVVLVLAAAAWFWFSRPAVTQAVDETVDVFVPDRQEFQRRTSVIDESRRLVDQINSRQGH